MFYVPLLGVVGGAIGSGMDLLINKKVYAYQPATPRVTVAPVLDRKGLMVVVVF